MFYVTVAALNIIIADFARNLKKIIRHLPPKFTPKFSKKSSTFGKNRHENHDYIIMKAI
jgi:hypothetical protein